MSPRFGRCKVVLAMRIRVEFLECTFVDAHARTKRRLTTSLRHLKFGKQSLETNKERTTDS